MSALEYERGRTEDMATNSKETFSIFPEKTEETKDAYDKAEKKINNSVKSFAKNLISSMYWSITDLERRCHAFFLHSNNQDFKSNFSSSDVDVVIVARGGFFVKQRT